MKLNWKTATAIFLLILITVPVYFVTNAIQKDVLLKHYLKTTTFNTAKNDFLRFATQKKVSDLNKQLPDSLKLKTLGVYIPDSCLKKLELDRLSKLSRGVQINRNKATYYPCLIFYNNDSIEAKIRVRGDTHENFNRGLYSTSFRINSKKKILGTNKFSIIRPFQDNNFFGFFYYHFLKSQNITTNNFKFIEVNINNTSQDIWILQEGFSNDLIKNNNKPKGLILRFDDDCLEQHYKSNQSGFPKLIPYQRKEIYKDSVLKKAYETVLQNTEKSKHNAIEISKVYDFKLWAKFVALNDIFLAHHSQQCHNVKLYFNITTKLLEPIAWDPGSFKDQPFEIAKNIFTTDAKNPPIYQFLQQDTLFNKLYLNYLLEYSTSKNIKQFIQSYWHYTSNIEPELNQHQVSIKFDTNYILNNMKRMRESLYTKQKLIVSAYKKGNLLEIRNNTLIPVYCSYIKVDGDSIPINKIIHREEPHSFFLKKQPLKKVKAYYKLCNEDKLSVEKGTVFEYKVWN